MPQSIFKKLDATLDRLLDDSIVNTYDVIIVDFPELIFMSDPDELHKDKVIRYRNFARAILDTCWGMLEDDGSLWFIAKDTHMPPNRAYVGAEGLTRAQALLNTEYMSATAAFYVANCVNADMGTDKGGQRHYYANGMPLYTLWNRHPTQYVTVPQEMVDYENPCNLVYVTSSNIEDFVIHGYLPLWEGSLLDVESFKHDDKYVFPIDALFTIEDIEFKQWTPKTGELIGFPDTVARYGKEKYYLKTHVCAALESDPVLKLVTPTYQEHVLRFTRYSGTMIDTSQGIRGVVEYTNRIRSIEHYIATHTMSYPLLVKMLSVIEGRPPNTLLISGRYDWHTLDDLSKDFEAEYDWSRKPEITCMYIPPNGRK